MNSTSLHESRPAALTYIGSSAFWWAFAFALATFLAILGKAIFRLAHTNAGASGTGPFDWFRTLGMPLIVCVLALGAYLNIKRVVSFVSDDPAVLRVITFYGLMVLGFAFLTIDLIF